MTKAELKEYVEIRLAEIKEALPDIKIMILEPFVLPGSATCNTEEHPNRWEYFRDVDKGLDIQVPAHYFPNDDITKQPLNTWRSHANLLYSNWLNYFVYQTTPYDIDEVGNK